MQITINIQEEDLFLLLPQKQTMSLYPYNQRQVMEFVELKARKYLRENNWFEDEIISQLQNRVVNMIKIWREHKR